MTLILFSTEIFLIGVILTLAINLFINYVSSGSASKSNRRIHVEFFLYMSVHIYPNLRKNIVQIMIKACVRYFLRNFYSPPNDRPSKTVKDVFISSKRLFSFSRYSDFCISTFLSFSPCQPLLERLIQDKS